MKQLSDPSASIPASVKRYSMPESAIYVPTATKKKQVQHENFDCERKRLSNELRIKAIELGKLLMLRKK